MKKCLLLLTAMAVFTCYAQNVGIGTRNPQNKLHIAGGVRIDSLASAKDSGLVLHNNMGDVFSVKLTGKKSDVLTGEGTFASATVTAGTPWLLEGNGNITASNFIGTTNQMPLLFRVNNRHYGSLGTNVAFGFMAIATPEAEAGTGNVALGGNALTIMKNSWENTAVGQGAMSKFVGPASVNEDASRNVAIGSYALLENINGSNNTAIGYYALSSELAGENLTAVGFKALGANKGGPNNTGVGFMSLRLNITGGQNTALGYSSLYGNVNGHRNTATGLESLYMNESGSGNTAYGYHSLYRNNGSNNTATGSDALFSNNSGINNSATGHQSLYSNTSGSYNQAFGYKSLFSATTSTNNTSVGYRTMYFNTIGSHNTAVGYIALNNNTSGNNNTAVGEGADVTTGALSNATAIGYNAKVNASNKVRIGNASVTRIEGQVPFTTPSDGRYKFNVKENVKGLEFILKLRPVTYQFDVNRFDNTFDNNNDNATLVAYTNATLVRRTGFIAQEVKQAAVTSNYNFSGISEPETAEDHYSLSYETFVVPLVKAVQEQQHLIITLREKLEQAEEKAAAQGLTMSEYEVANKAMKKELADFAKRLKQLELK